MKALDKFLKVLKTDRNTFFAYILMLCSVYVIVDRVCEFLLILITGVASEYWGPIHYTIAFAFPVFAFLFGMSSKFIKGDTDKHKMFNIYCISLYILAICMVTEWINKFIWMGLISLPGYSFIIHNLAYLVHPALSSLAIVLPLTTGKALFDKLYKGVNDSKIYLDSITDYGGISLSDKSKGWGPYTSEIVVGTDTVDKHPVKLPESKRFESTLVVGISGSGKTTLIFEPWVAQDINRKFFFRETSKVLAISALKAGIATLDAPYDNDYINSNFTLNMLVPVQNKMALYKEYFKNLILAEQNSKFIYKNLGITYMAPDYETIEKVKNICDNFEMPYYMIDPDNKDSIGLNPFSFDDPVQTALSISTVLKGFYSDKNPDSEVAYRENLSNQIIENLSILLKVAYPKLNSGKLPNINDMLKLLNDFDLIEKMCKILEQDPELSEKYENQISYFKKNFYAGSPNRSEMEKLVSFPETQLDTLLRYPGVKRILCNRTNNLNFDDVLKNGDICLVCTRRGDLGENAHKAFGLFCLLLMQFSILRRPGNENTRISHFLYIDEFPDFICPATESLFTVYRKYRIGTVVSAQNLSQITAKGEKLGNTIIANCSNKIVFGNNSPEDNDWWQKELGTKKEWTVNNDAYDFKEDKYKGSGSAKMEFKDKFQAGKIQSLQFKQGFYKIRTLNGKFQNGIANLDFLPSKYNEKQKVKKFQFDSFSNGITEEREKEYDNMKFGKKGRNLSYAHFTSENEDDGPIKLDSSDLNFDINNDDAVTFTFKKNKKQ